MKEVYIVSAARTPIGKFLGSLSPFGAPELGGFAIRAAVGWSGLRSENIEEVIMGQALQAGVGQAPARQAMLKAGLPESASATTINKVCASGLEAIHIGALKIQTGEANCLVAGGMESMSRAPHILKNSRNLKMGDVNLVDSAISDGLWCAFENTHMGNLAEFIARERGINRMEMDKFALLSHLKAVSAINKGKFLQEIIPVPQFGGKGFVGRDENPRADTSMEKLMKLDPVFEKGSGIVTAGNAPGLADGAAALVLAEKSWLEKSGIPPLAKITGYATAATEPKWLFAAPEVAIKKLLARTKTQLSDYHLLEVNEAFAAQILANGQALNWDWDRVNVNGGAIALGHPVGATGARIVVTLVHALKARGLKSGLAALCHGGGGAVAMSFELSRYC
ncbi:thiolase family protein [Candidatus Daviesbacteria bacterium]|nr:thiolase family protein [Candidatus Daviesbacteria bacterium]